MSDAKIRVTIDTRKAKADLKDLTKSASGAAGGVGGGLRNVIGQGLRMTGAGAAFGAGYAAISGALRGTASSAISESIGGYLSRGEELVFGDLGPEGRAAQSAREKTIQRFGYMAGDMSTSLNAAHQSFKMEERVALRQEIGRRRIEQDQNFRGPDLEELVRRLGVEAGKSTSNFAGWMHSRIPRGMSIVQGMGR